MNQKELNEIRRRWKPDKNAISRIYGCYVNGNKDIISEFDTSLGLMGESETEIYLGVLKKALSGTLGKNLMDIEFSTQQVAGSEEHSLLMKLKQSACKDDAARSELFRKIAASLSLDDGNYLILLAGDAYDVPFRGSDEDDQADAGGEVYSYFLCCICPVKDASLELRYDTSNGEFHSTSTGHVAAAPALGFLFPCFDDRSTNIYNVLYYAHKPAEIHQEFIDAIFRADPPMSAPEQRDTFSSVIRESLENDCSLEVVQAVHTQMRELLAMHKDAKIPVPLELSINQVGDILEESGLDDTKVDAFRETCSREFGEDATLNPSNILDTKKFQIETPEAKITIPSENSHLLHTRVIDGRKYLLIPADNGVEINGIPINIAVPDNENTTEE